MSFSLPGFIIIAVILLPNLLFVIFPPINPPGKLKDGGLIINAIEHGGRILFFLFLIFTPYDPDVARNPMLFVLMIICAALYYALWLHYIRKGRPFSALFDTVLGVPIPMAILPVLSFAFAVIWLQSWLAVIPLSLFAIGHFINSSISARQINS
ncbi:MAG: hypothetical protein JEZ00_06420 [Anaerolineaceae bacterium]|nr:hypothetical protein [Anaerolineaceae bacterium]